jgi:mono/diheme cytochrome c family protein
MWRIRRRTLILAVAISVTALVLLSAIPIVLSSRAQDDRVARAMTRGEPTRAPAILRRYGCTGCHTIPGVPGADGLVGGSLADIRRRVYVGGTANNSPENLIRWIVLPQSFSSSSAMPATGISEAEARDVAAYLYSQ